MVGYSVGPRQSAINAIVSNDEPIVVVLEDLIGEDDYSTIDAMGILTARKEPIFTTTIFIVNKLSDPIKIQT